MHRVGWGWGVQKPPCILGYLPSALTSHLEPQALLFSSCGSRGDVNPESDPVRSLNQECTLVNHQREVTLEIASEFHTTLTFKLLKIYRKGEKPNKPRVSSPASACAPSRREPHPNLQCPLWTNTLMSGTPRELRHAASALFLSELALVSHVFFQRFQICLY